MPRKKVIIDSAYVMQLKLEGLKKLCAKHKLSKKGRKAELQKRILQHLKLDTKSGEADTDAISSKENKATLIAKQVREHDKEDGSTKERIKHPVQKIRKDEREELECSEREQQKMSEGTLKEIPNQSKEDFDALKTVKDEGKSDVSEEKVKVTDKEDGSLEESKEPDECSGREQPMLLEKGALKEIPNHCEEDVEALKSVKKEVESVIGNEKVKTTDKADGILEEPKDLYDCSGPEQPKLSVEGTLEESPSQSEKDLEMHKSVKNESEKTQKRSVVEAGLTVDGKSMKKHKIPAGVHDQKCISTNLNMQKNADQARSSPLVDDLAGKKFDTIEKMHPNAPLKDMKPSVTLGKKKEDIARYLASLETGELVSLCTKLCAADNKLFRVLSKLE